MTSALPAAVLWDMDGTLIDTEPYWIRCEQELVAAHGGRWTDADAMSIVGFDLMDSAEVLRTRGGVQLRPQEIIEQLSDGVIALLRQRIPWRPGARELLAALKLRGVPCALVTMSWLRLADEVIRQLPPGSFQAVITGDRVMNGKPHPEPYRRAAEELGVDPLASVAIEDSPAGIASAEAAGCVVVAVENIVPLEPAPGRVMLTTLQGVTPEALGEYVENTPPPAQRPEPGPPPAPPTESATRPTDAVLRRRRMVVGAGAAAVALLVAVAVWFFAIRDTGPHYDPGAFNVHAWAPDWELDDSTPQLPDRANVFHQLSPFWYDAQGVTIIEVSDRVDTDEKLAATEEFLDEARSRGVPIVPSITDATDSGVMAAILADPTERAAHVEAIASFADEHGFDGIDINYENFAFEDDRDTWATTRPNWVTFISELGTRLQADGRILTVSVPWVVDGGRTEDSGYWVYDYGAIAPYVDAIRVLAYDYAVAEPGPIAPIDWVSDVIDGSIEAAGGPEKLVLGIPLYGRNWVVATDGDCPDDVPGTEGLQLDSVDDLLARRNATPTHDPETAEAWFTYDVEFEEGDQSCTQTREVHYMDAEGARQRMQLSIDRGLLGVALFGFGYDSVDIWDRIAEINATLETEPGSAPPATTDAATTAEAATTVATTTAAPTTTTATTTTVRPTTTG
jgi:HAD superfamily hydrolase (TIGR01509 family)